MLLTHINMHVIQFHIQYFIVRALNPRANIVRSAKYTTVRRQMLTFVEVMKF